MTKTVSLDDLQSVLKYSGVFAFAQKRIMRWVATPEAFRIRQLTCRAASEIVCAAASGCKRSSNNHLVFRTEWVRKMGSEQSFIMRGPNVFPTASIRNALMAEFA